MSRKLRIFLIAGESSGDRLGAGIMRELKAQHQNNVDFYGVGGPEMQREGMKSLFPYHELALIGITEVLPKMLQILSRIGRVVEEVQNVQPDMLITIDVPGFNLRVVKKLKHEKFKTIYVHVVAPTVWAYRPERAAECARYFDHMLVLLPFEPPYFTEVGLPCTYIGHPTVWAGNAKPNGQAFRDKHRIPENQPIIALLPGSRHNEIKRHMAIMSQAVNAVALQQQIMPVLVSSASAHTRVLMTEYFSSSPFRNILVFDQGEKLDAMAASDVALVKSGTVTLEVAYANTPMIVTYKLNPITASIVRKLINIKQVSLVNILEEQQVIPEYLQENATAENLSHGLLELMTSPEAQIYQRRHFEAAIAKLQPAEAHSPFYLAAQKILQLLNPKSA